MWNRKHIAVAFFLAFVILYSPADACASDEEGCLICHGLGLRKPSSNGGSELKVSDRPGGPHEGNHCSDCHADAKTAPHPSSPGPAACIGECHSTSAKARDSHRAASYGGLTEPHRMASAPKAPCLLCHRAEDKKGDLAAVVRRCGECHPEQWGSAERGIHSRIRQARDKGTCPLCHVAHPAPAAERGQAAVAKAVCTSKECHTVLSEGMRQLGRHDSESGRGRKPGREAKAGVHFALVALGGLSGILAVKRHEPGRKR